MPHRLSVLAVAGLLALAPPALAQVVETVPVVPGDTMISVDEARDIAVQNGVDSIDSIELDTNSGRWEVEGVDADDRDIDLEIDARTGAVLRVDR